LVLSAWRQWLASGGTPDVLGEFYDTLDEALQDRISTLLGILGEQPPTPDDLMRSDAVDTGMRLRVRNLQRRIRELRYFLEDTQDSAAAPTYGPLITEATTRIRTLQKSMNERSISGRRQREDAAIRVPFAEA
jgi:hypothetical protein